MLRSQQLKFSDIDVSTMLYEHSLAMLTGLRHLVSILPPSTQFYYLASQLYEFAQNDLSNLGGENATSNRERIANAVYHNRKICLGMEALQAAALKRDINNKSYDFLYKKTQEILGYLLNDDLLKRMNSSLKAALNSDYEYRHLFDVAMDDRSVLKVNHIHQQFSMMAEEFQYAISCMETSRRNDKAFLREIDARLFDSKFALNRILDAALKIPNQNIRKEFLTNLIKPIITDDKKFSKDEKEDLAFLTIIPGESESDIPGFISEEPPYESKGRDKSSFDDAIHSLLDYFLLASQEVIPDEHVERIFDSLVSIKEFYFGASLGFYAKRESKNPLITDFNAENIKKIILDFFWAYNGNLKGVNDVVDTIVKLLDGYTIDSSQSDAVLQKITGCLKVEYKTSFLVLGSNTLVADSVKLGELSQYLDVNCERKLQLANSCIFA
jgi:hypothetical protein